MPNYTLGQKANATKLYDLELPTGATCQARRPGVQGFIEAGILDNFDQLTALVQTEHVDKHSPAAIARAEKLSQEQIQAAAAGLMSDPSKLAMSLQMIDRLVVATVTQPAVWVDYRLTDESEEDWEKRQKEQGDRLAVRGIEIEDKMFLMTWAVGGSSDLVAFRAQFSVALGGVAASETVPHEAE